MTETAFSPAPNDAGIAPGDVHRVVGHNMLADGMDLVLDLDKSRGRHLVDARNGRRFLDMFTFFASSALGMNHPALADDDSFLAELAGAAVNKPSNSDVYTVPMARFVDTFARVLGDPALPHLFFVDGGALAVENALKVAFDWKSRLNESRGLEPALGMKVLHVEGAFHGRSGYTMSLTNTDPIKVARFPKFDWPRIESPYIRPDVDMDEVEQRSLRQAREAFESDPNDIACFIIEPIQGEGGDRHFRPQFLSAMRQMCDEFDALLIFDEVQTGCGITGTAWAFQQLGVTPDVLSFGKKTQVCGVMAGPRVDDVADNVFRVSSRINSTWGGNLVDMVRARRILETIEAEGLFEQARDRGKYLLKRLEELSERQPSSVLNVRGRGLMCAFDSPSQEQRDALIAKLWERDVVMLPSGQTSVRFRPPLTVTENDIDAAMMELAALLDD